MRMTCPFCGPRDLAEFSYCGDAGKAASRPDPSQADQAVWNRWIYDRPNPAGPHGELWQHSGGCRRHLHVTRDTRTHEILDTGFWEAGT